MLHVYAPSLGRLADITAGPQTLLPEGATWIDLVHPTPKEEALIERSLGIKAPTHEEMQEIEPSSRLYQEKGALFLTAGIVSGDDAAHPESTAVTFILAGQRLVTIRYAEPRSFATFAAHAARQPGLYASGSMALVGLLEAVVDRTADILERVGTDLDTLSKDVFGVAAGPVPAQAASRDFEKVPKRIARDQDLTAKARDSLVSLGRLLGFLALPGEVKQAKDLRARTKTLARDVASLTDHTAFISNNITFLLDASMGMINIEQNAIIKIFSVAAIVFLPPTLVAGICGMNFAAMPELGWHFGYPFAFLLMLLSVIPPYLWFKRRGRL